MRENHVVIEPFELIDLLSCDIRKKVNEHATVRFSGHIMAEQEDKYVEMNLEELWATVTVLDEENAAKPLFKGMVRSLEIATVNGVKTLTGELASGSYLMDTMEHTRTFQDESMLYKDVQRFYLSGYPDNGLIETAAQGETIGKNRWLLQYQETDWEFTRRLASHFGSFLVPDYRVGGVKYFFGMPRRSDPAAIYPAHFSVNKHVDEYICKQDRRVQGLRERDAMYYTFESREIYDIGDVLVLNGRTLYVHEIRSRIAGSELVHTYYLKTEAGFKTPREHNRRMIGASLAANIIDVQRDVVKVHVQADPKPASQSSEVAAAKWFPYSTVYSTPDGTGWYAMPEIGDEMRLYIPTEEENDSYVISAVHLNSAAPDERADPDRKSIMNKWRKEVLFTPDMLRITNNKGMSIEILDDYGIKIDSDKKICITSDDSVNVASVSSVIDVNAPSLVTITQGGASLKLQGDVYFSGGQVKMQ